MPRIELTTMVDAPIDRVYAVARDVESFPEFMDDLQALNVLERSDDGDRTITEWVGVIREFKMTIKWTQEDIWNATTYRDDFRLIKGDMDSMSGYWQFTADASGAAPRTRFESVVDYEYAVPLIGPMIKALIRKKMEANLDAQMQAIKARAETAA